MGLICVQRSLNWLTRISFIRMIPSGIFGLSGIVLASVLGIQYFRQRKLNRAPSPRFKGTINRIFNHFRLRLNPDSFLEKTEQLNQELGGIMELRSFLSGFRSALSSLRGLYSFRSENVLRPAKRFVSRDILLISDLDAAKDIFQSGDEKYREKNMLNWMDSVGIDSKNDKSFDNWLAEQKEVKKKYKTFTFERSSPDQMEKLYETVLPTLRTLFSSNEKLPALSRSDVMLLTTNILMEYLCGKRFHLRNERFSRLLDEVDQLHENFVLKHVYLRDLFGMAYRNLLLCAKRNVYRQRAEIASNSAKYIIEFLESDAGLIEMREAMREKYSDGSYPDESGLNFAQVLIKSHLENPEKISWPECVKAIASLVSNASPISNMTMTSLGYLSLDGEAQNLINDEIFRKFGSNRTEYLSVEKTSKLVRMRAVLMETYRMVSSPPILFTAEKDTVINGYNVLRGTNILVNINQLNHSPKLWDEPEKFNPGRFLTTSEKDPEMMIIKSPPAYIPYNFGRKSQAMIGLLEHVASNILANIVSQFTIDSNRNRQEMGKSGLGSYKSIDMKNFFTVNLNKRN